MAYYVQPEIRRLCTLLQRTVLLTCVIKYYTKCVEVKQSRDRLRGKDIAISVNTNTGQRDSTGIKELRIREKVNWVDGCEEYLVTVPSYSYRYSPCSYVLYNLVFYVHIHTFHLVATPLFSIFSILLIIYLRYSLRRGAGWISGQGTTLRTGRSRVPFPLVSLEFFSDIILPVALWPWGSTQSPTEMSTRCISWG